MAAKRGSGWDACSVVRGLVCGPGDVGSGPAQFHGAFPGPLCIESGQKFPTFFVGISLCCNPTPGPAEQVDRSFAQRSEYGDAAHATGASMFPCS